MTDVDSIVDNILLSHATAEDDDGFRKFVAVAKVIDIIVPFLITAALVVAVFIAAACS
jgi:hypothetical protein